MRNRVTRILVTLNYAVDEKTPMENYVTMHQDLEQMQRVIEADRDLEVAAAWEEYGAAGNAHIHALL